MPTLRYFNRPRQAACLCLAALFWSCLAAAGELPVSWQALQFEARKLFVHGEFHVALTPLEPAEARAALWPDEGKPLQPAAGLLRLDGRMSLLGNRAQLKLWLDPADLRTYQRWRLTEGSQRRLKTTRFLADSLLWTRREPGSSDQAPEQWPAVREKRIAYPQAGTVRWLDPVSLLLAAGDTKLSQPGDGLSVPVFTDQQPYRAMLRFAGRETLDVDYRLLEGGKQTRIKGRREMLRIDVKYAPLTKLEDKPEFNLLGLTGDIRIYVDPEYRIPVQVEGEADSRGRLAVKLREAVIHGR